MDSNTDELKNQLDDIIEDLITGHNFEYARKEILDLITTQNKATYEAVMEAIGEDAASRHIRVRKNTHGPCCQCQICGEDYDDCIMRYVKDEDELRAELRQKVAKIFGVTEGGSKS